MENILLSFDGEKRQDPEIYYMVCDCEFANHYVYGTYHCILHR